MSRRNRPPKLIREAMARLEAQAAATPPVQDPGEGKPITEAMIDEEMVRRGFATFLTGGFVGAEKRIVRPPPPASDDWRDKAIAAEVYERRRAQCRSELEAFEVARKRKTKGNRPASQKANEAESYARALISEKGMSKVNAARLAARRFDVAESTVRNRLKKESWT